MHALTLWPERLGLVLHAWNNCPHKERAATTRPTAGMLGRSCSGRSVPCISGRIGQIQVQSELSRDGWVAFAKVEADLPHLLNTMSRTSANSCQEYFSLPPLPRRHDLAVVPEQFDGNLPPTPWNCLAFSGGFQGSHWDGAGSCLVHAGVLRNWCLDQP